MLPEKLQPEQIAQVLAGLPGDRIGLRDRAVVLACYAGGLQLAEVAGSRLGDLDFAAALWRVGARTIPLDAPFYRALSNYVRLARPALLGKCRWDTLFLSQRGSPLSTRALQERLGHYGLSPQLLRNSYIAHLLAGGADAQIVQVLVGHRSAAAALNHRPLAPQGLRRICELAHPRAPSQSDR